MGRKNQIPMSEKAKPEDSMRKLLIGNEIKNVKPVAYIRSKGHNINCKKIMAGSVDGKLVLDPRTKEPIPYKTIVYNMDYVLNE